MPNMIIAGILEDLRDKRQCRLNTYIYRNDKPVNSVAYIAYDNRAKELTAEIEELEKRYTEECRKVGVPSNGY